MAEKGGPEPALFVANKLYSVADRGAKVPACWPMHEDVMSDQSTFHAPGTATELEEGTALTPKFDADGLVTGVATDAELGDVLMVAHMNAQALAKTIATGEAWYFSRSRASAVEEGRELRPHPARRRNARRLRSGCGLDQGRAERRRLPHRPPVLFLSRGAARQMRARSRSNFATSACSIRRRSIAVRSSLIAEAGCGRRNHRA